MGAVVLHSLLPLFPTRDAGSYAFAFQRFSEPIRVIAPVAEQPIDIRQAAQQGPRADRRKSMGPDPNA
jgi:hypothetical protein